MFALFYILSKTTIHDCVKITDAQFRKWLDIATSIEVLAWGVRDRRTIIVSPKSIATETFMSSSMICFSLKLQAEVH